MSSVAWREWTPLPGAPTYTADSLREQLDGGQAFRWHAAGEQTWIGAWDNHIAALRLVSPDSECPGQLQWTTLREGSRTNDTTVDALRHYLGLADDRHANALRALPLGGDTHLATCVAAYPGLRILRQPFGETLLGFLCSATKQIVQIKQMHTLLATHLGAPNPVCHVLRDKLPMANSGFIGGASEHICHVIRDNGLAYRLPSWARLAEATDAELRACQLGFRARYIRGTALFLADRSGWLEETATLPYTEAKARLLLLPGVGEKIADCVLLFGLAHHAAFPVDTWMIKAMARRYGLESWRPDQIAHFGRVHYGSAAGLAQQYLFAWERAHGGR